MEFYGAMIRYRGARDALGKGTIQIVAADDDHLMFLRDHEGTRILCAFNLSGTPCTLPLPAGAWARDPLAPFAAEIANGQITLGPYAAGFAADQN